jgi:hypothetical protein
MKAEEACQRHVETCANSCAEMCKGMGLIVALPSDWFLHSHILFVTISSINSRDWLYPNKNRHALALEHHLGIENFLWSNKFFFFKLGFTCTP